VARAKLADRPVRGGGEAKVDRWCKAGAGPSPRADRVARGREEAVDRPVARAGFPRKVVVVRRVEKGRAARLVKAARTGRWAVPKPGAGDNWVAVAQRAPAEIPPDHV